MVKPVLLFAVGLLFLIKGGDWFVDGAAGLAHRFHVPELLIGATVVSIGTTLPEVMVSASAAVGGHGEIAYGNAIGSVICNTALIAALTVAIRPGKVDKVALRNPVAFFFIAAVYYMATAYLTGSFSRITGLCLLTVFVLYMALTVRVAVVAGGKAVSGLQSPAGTVAAEGKEKEQLPVKHLILLVIGAAAIAVGAKLLVNNGTLIAQALGVPESVIALTFVALGTSLPELVTAITSLARGHGALSLGNVIGANLFNLVLVSGLSTALSPFTVPASKTVFGGLNSSLAVEMPLMVLVMVLLCLPALIKGRLFRWQGILLLLIYAAFCVYQFAA